MMKLCEIVLNQRHTSAQLLHQLLSTINMSKRTHSETVTIADTRMCPNEDEKRGEEVDTDDDDDDIMHDPDIRRMAENGEHTCHMFDAFCQACADEDEDDDEDEDEGEDEDEDEDEGEDEGEDGRHPPAVESL